jgi:hypothetical protein
MSAQRRKGEEEKRGKGEERDNLLGTLSSSPPPLRPFSIFSVRAESAAEKMKDAVQ